jgi:archaellum biogenesis protein FlaJ (TadC family)
MSFREKTAWVTLIAILLVIAFFFTHGPEIWSPAPDPWTFHLLAAAMGAFLAIEVVAYVVLYLKYPKDARTPRDEREEIIALKGTRLAAWVYMIGSFVALLTIHHGATARTIPYLIVLAFAVAQVVNYAARIVYYRRGF